MPNRLVTTAIWFLAFASASAALAGAADAQTGDVGFRDQHFSGTGTSVTGAKPESKLWWNDGHWWASMWDEAAAENFIFRLDPVAQTWQNTGVVIDNRAGTRADALWDGTKLYVASHGFTNTASSGFQSRLYRFSYDRTTDTYTRDAGFPVAISNWKTETLVLAKDSTGKLWATWTQGNAVYVNRTIGDDKTWGTPFALPVAGAADLTADDISSVVAFDGNKVGVMWSNQNASLMGFAVHVDGQPDTTWSRETALDGAGNADDHINLKADAAGRVYAAVKTSQTDAEKPLTLLLVRDPASASWTKHTFGLRRDRHTRPMVLLDESSGLVHMFATAGEEGGTVYRKTSPMDQISFEAGLGTPFIRDGSSADMNDATSTKQTVTSVTDIVVMASNNSTRYYWHNSADIAQTRPEAEFTGTPTSGGAPLRVEFSDLSTGDPTSWRWNFGDGTTSTEQHPTHTYLLSGTYTVTLTVAAADGETSTRTKSGYVTVSADPLGMLDANFTATPTSGTAPLAVAFTDTSSGAAVRWAWDFGDGTTSTAQHPRHTYANPGAYTVTLRVTDLLGNPSTETKTNYIVAVPLVAEFSGMPTSGPAPLAVAFTDTSTGGAVRWAWDFGDGATSTEQHPRHTYEAAGTYTVTLTVTAANGATSTMTKADYVSSLALTADFSATPTLGAAPVTVAFSDRSIGYPTSWAWSFGDGTTSSERHPTHTYTAAGTYTVTLTVTDASGATSTKTRTDYVTASSDHVLTPSADAYVNSSYGDRNFGGATSVRVRNGDLSPPHYRSFFQFSVSGLSAPVTSARLRLYVSDGATDGGSLYGVAGGWTETGITFANAPAVAGASLAALGKVTAGTWVDVPLPASVFSGGNGTYSFALVSTNPTGGTAHYHSREGANRPQLVLAAG